MSKKHRRKQEKEKPKAVKKTNLQVVTCVECMKDGSTLKMQECQACTDHENGYCNYLKPKKMVKIIGFGTPMRYNRNLFQMSSDNLREQSLNYYITTDIMNEVRSIDGYPNYRKLKTALLSGEFKEAKVAEQPIVLKAECIKPLHFLVKGKGGFNEFLNSCTDPTRDAKLSNADPDMWDLLIRKKTYFLTEWEGGYISGDWNVVYFLYRMYELDGFGDIELDGQPYRVLFNEAKGTKADLVVAEQEDKVVIGRKVANES